MTQWQLYTKYVSIYSKGISGLEPSLLWTRKDPKTGKTDWDELTALAAEGWELVSVTPIADEASGGRTRLLLYTFKRPKPEK